MKFTSETNIRPVKIFQLNYVVLLILFSIYQLNGQVNRYTLWVPSFISVDSSSIPIEIKSLRFELMNQMTQTKLFQILDRDYIHERNKEQELQKTESFIDGYVIEQGKSLGAEFLLSCEYNPYSKKVIYKLINLKNQSIDESTAFEISKNNEINNKRNIKNIELLIKNILAKNTFQVIRILESKDDKALVLLIAGGYDNGLLKKSKFEIFYTYNEIFENEPVTRKVILGNGEISLIEGPKLAQLNIKKGHKEIFENNKSKKLFCSTIN